MARKGKRCYIKRAKVRMCFCSGKRRKLSSCGVKPRKKLSKKGYCKPKTTRKRGKSWICTTRGGGTKFVTKRMRRR